MKKFIKLTIIAFLVISCAPKAAESTSEEYGMTTLDATLNEEESVDATVKKTDGPDLVMKKIIKDGRLGIKVGKLKEAKMNVDTLVRNMGLVWLC